MREQLRPCHTSKAGMAKEIVDDLNHQSFLNGPSLGDLGGILGCV